MKRPLSLTDSQLRLIEHAARSLPVDARDGFLQSVTTHLADQPSDNAVQGAVHATLDRTPVFLCDAKPKEKRTPSNARSSGNCAKTREG